MGWTWYNADYYKNGKVDRKKEIDESWNNADNFSVVKSSLVGTTYYGAIKNKKDNSIFAVVYLTKTNEKDYYNFGYKDMDETMLPYCFDCPKSILDILTATDNECANEWRKKCREKMKNKKDSLSNLKIGAVIEWTDYNGKKVRCYKHAPAYQFKTAFWLFCDKFCYCKKNHIPADYKVISY